MARATVIQTNFTGGEFSPRLLGRVDIAKYPNGCETIENALPLIHGGVTNHYGSIYVAAAKFAAKRARLVPFVSSVNSAYVLEFGDLYMRVYTNNGQVAGPFEVATPYTEAMLPELDYAQGVDTMFLFHPTNAIYRNRRFADNAWDVSVAPFSVVPVDEVGDFPAGTITLSLATVGAARTATASGTPFLVSDVGRSITYLGGTFTITAFIGTNQVTGDITTPFASVNVPNGWNLTLTPFTTLTPGVATPVGVITTLTLGAAGWRTTDVGKFVAINGGRLQITSFTSNTIVNARITQILTGVTAAPADSWVLQAPMWSANFGYPRTGTIHQQKLWSAGSPGFAQTFWASAAGLYFDNTLGLGDSDALAYTLGSEQANPIRHLVAGRTLSALTYGGEFAIKGGVEKAITPTNIQVDSQTNYGCSALRPVRAGSSVIFGQRNGRKLRLYEYSAANDAFDSSDLTALSEHITGTGLADMCYAAEPDPIVWAVRSDGAMATLTFSEEQNVQAWARRVTDGFYESVASIPTATGDQTWAIVRRTVNGATVRYVERFESTCLLDCAVTGASGTVSVTNMVNIGGVGAFVEVTTATPSGLSPGDLFDISGVIGTLGFAAAVNNSWAVSSVTSPTVFVFSYTPFFTGVGPALTGAWSSGGVVTSAGLAIWAGLGYLEGKTVACIADGSDMGNFVVTGGQITLPRKALAVTIGLLFTATIKPLTLEMQTGTGTAQGQAMNTSEVVLRSLNTDGIKINGKLVAFRKFGAALLDRPPPAYTGIGNQSTLGWAKGSSDMVLTQDRPVPFHILDIVRTFTVNSGGSQ